jgi:hypothetical protein
MSNVGDDPYYCHMHQETLAVCDVAGTLGCFDQEYYYQTNCHASSNKNSNDTKDVSVRLDTSLNSAVVGTTPAATAATGDETERAEAVLAPIEEEEEEGDLHRLQVAPTIVTAGMELNEWAVSITYKRTVKKNSRNVTLYGCCCIVLSCLEAILYCGKVRLMNDQNSAMSTPMRSFMNQIVLLESFHRALLGCCSVCVTKAFDFTLKLRVSPYMRPMPLDSILYITCSSAYEYLEGFRHVRSITFR